MEPERVVMWIPFLAITTTMVTIVILIVLLHRAKIRELDQRHRERMAAIEKGMDPSFGGGAEVVEAPRMPLRTSDRPPPRYLLRGLMWFGVGLAFVFTAASEAGAWAALPGWIAAAVGGAYVVYYVMYHMMEGRSSPPPASPPERPPSRDQGL